MTHSTHRIPTPSLPCGLALFTRVLAVFTAVFLAALALNGPAAAFPDGGASTPSCQNGYRWCASKGKCVRSSCKRGRVWSSARCRCVRRSSELLSDEDFYQEAVLAAEREHYQDALDLLHRIKNRNQARVLNYIGYSTRKLGRLEEGIAYYQKALALNPDYVLAREYLGEGLLNKGDLAGAKIQLEEIKNRCGTDCHEYEELAEVIAEYESKLN